MRSRLGLLVTLLLGASAVSAEVRLRAGTQCLELAVEPVAQGIWTPSGEPDIYTVNPQGDLLGDGFPAHRSTSGRLVAAWQRPARSAVVVLRATSPASSTSVEVESADVVGIPIITDLDSRSLVAWQSGAAAPVVMAVLASGGGVSSPISILPGRLLGVYRIDDAVHIVAFDAARRAVNIGTIPASWEPNPIPVPILRVPLLRTFGVAPLEATPPPDFVTSPATWLPCVDERGTDVLLAWQAGRGVLGRVILDAYGVDGAGEFRRGPNGSCQAILNAAARD